jgi:hypothetical protein
MHDAVQIFVAAYGGSRNPKIKYPTGLLENTSPSSFGLHSTIVDDASLLGVGQGYVPRATLQNTDNIVLTAAWQMLLGGCSSHRNFGFRNKLALLIDFHT